MSLRKKANSKEMELAGTAKEAPGIMHDAGGMLLLLLLYTLQGIPMGLGGSIPFILQKKVGYKEQAIFNLVSWPFSLKLLWAPLVDAIYSRHFGRRKSWLVPTQLFTGVIMLFMSTRVGALLGDDGSEPAVQTLTMLFFILYFMMATQDIAVDGWALTILSKQNVGIASTCNSVGQTLGYFVAYVGFLALNDTNTCNKFFRITPSDSPMVTLDQFLYFWGWVFIATTLAVWALKTEKRGDDEDEIGVRETYKQLWSVLQLPAVQTLGFVMVTCKMGFAAADNVTSLKIVEYGLPKEDLAMMAPLLIPCGIVIPIIISKFTSGPDPMGVFMLGVIPRIGVGVMYIGLVYVTSQTVGAGGEVPRWLYGFIIGAAILHEVAANLMFVAQMAFFNRISDERIGGTYMTLLNTIANLGSKWPASVVMFLVDPLTTKGCTGTTTHNGCGTPHEIKTCEEGGGKCTTIQDGYYTLSIGCTVLAILWLVVMQGRVKRLRELEKDKWKVH